jgi:hypothetical protein
LQGRQRQGSFFVTAAANLLSKGLSPAATSAVTAATNCLQTVSDFVAAAVQRFFLAAVAAIERKTCRQNCCNGRLIAAILSPALRVSGSKDALVDFQENIPNRDEAELKPKAL